MTVNAIRLFATQYISLWSKAWFYRVERYNTLKEEKEKAGDFSQIYKAIDLSKFRLFIDTAIPYKKTRSVQQPGEEWSSPIHGRVLSPPEIPSKKDREANVRKNGGGTGGAPVAVCGAPAARVYQESGAEGLIQEGRCHLWNTYILPFSN